MRLQYTISCRFGGQDDGPEPPSSAPQRSWLNVTCVSSIPA